MEARPDAMNQDADSLAAYLQGAWGLPLGSARAAPGYSTADFAPVSAPEIARLAWTSGDLRLVRAMPLWLTLTPEVDTPSGWTIEDRRRLAYLCELAQALASLREACRRPQNDRWAASVAGIEPQPWQEKVPLCDSPGPAATPSIFGELWGIEEPMTFPEYAGFQDQFLLLRRREERDATRAGTGRGGHQEADPALR